MQHYIRLAGIDEKGATDVLKLLPTAKQTVETIANLFDFERK
jgi:ribulose bisphosphate carboxylase small subunit